jgi:DNA-binding beta-propeller fold protein YncE
LHPDPGPQAAIRAQLGCFNTVPPGIATCLGRGEANPPILQFDPSGKLLKSLGAGMFVNPHGFTVDQEGNLWVSDVNDKQTVNFIDGSLLAFIPDPSDLSMVGAGTSASGIAADAMGNVYAADVGAHKVRKYILSR